MTWYEDSADHTNSHSSHEINFIHSSYSPQIDFSQFTNSLQISFIHQALAHKMRRPLLAWERRRTIVAINILHLTRLNIPEMILSLRQIIYCNTEGSHITPNSLLMSASGALCRTVVPFFTELYASGSPKSPRITCPTSLRNRFDGLMFHTLNTNINNYFLRIIMRMKIIHTQNAATRNPTHLILFHLLIHTNVFLHWF